MTRPTRPVPGPHSRPGGYALAVLALLTCPCHLPVLALLLSGTAAGALLSEHLGAAVEVFSVLFVLFLVAAMRALRAKSRSYSVVGNLDDKTHPEPA